MLDDIDGGIPTWQKTEDTWRTIATRHVDAHHIDEIIDYAKAIGIFDSALEVAAILAQERVVQCDHCSQ